MRTKDLILDYAMRDITDKTQRSTTAFWLEHHKLEVLIDIRDILAADMQTSMAISKAMKNRKQ